MATKTTAKNMCDKKDNVLSKKLTITNNTIQILQNTITDLKETIRTCVRSKKFVEEEMSSVPSHEKKIMEYSQLITDTECQINVIKKKIKHSENTIKQRADLKDILPTYNTSYIRKKQININFLQKQIRQFETVIEKSKHHIRAYSLSSVNKIRNVVIEQTKNITKCELELLKKNKLLKQISSLILEDDMRQEYEEYSQKWDLEYDEVDTFDLFRQCNKHHHLYNNINGHKTNSRCSESDRDRDLILRVDKYGDVEGECQCGEHSWVASVPEDLSLFNLHSSEVYGEMRSYSRPRHLFLYFLRDTTKFI